MSEQITDEFQKRLAEKPDKWTLAWWSAQFQEALQSNAGLKHALHLALAELEDAAKLREQIQALESAAEQDRAKIGELQAALETAIGRLDRQGEFLTTLKKNGK